jgi:hypothetical protein
MNKKPNKSKGPAKSASKHKIAIKDLKAKNAGSVKGGVDSGLLKLTPETLKIDESTIKINTGTIGIHK